MPFKEFMKGCSSSSIVNDWVKEDMRALLRSVNKYLNQMEESLDICYALARLNSMEVTSGHVVVGKGWEERVLTIVASHFQSEQAHTREQHLNFLVAHNNKTTTTTQTQLF